MIDLYNMMNSSAKTFSEQWLKMGVELEVGNMMAGSMIGSKVKRKVLWHTFWLSETHEWQMSKLTTRFHLEPNLANLIFRWELKGSQIADLIPWTIQLLANCFTNTIIQTPLKLWHQLPLWVHHPSNFPMTFLVLLKVHHIYSLESNQPDVPIKSYRKQHYATSVARRLLRQALDLVPLFLFKSYSTLPKYPFLKLVVNTILLKRGNMQS